MPTNLQPQLYCTEFDRDMFNVKIRLPLLNRHLPTYVYRTYDHDFWTAVNVPGRMKYVFVPGFCRNIV